MSSPRPSRPSDAADNGILRLSVRAERDRSGVLVAHAQGEAGTGDESWQDYVVRADRGAAATARLVSRAEFLVDGRPDHVEVTNDGVWLERVGHVPQLEEQVREIAYKDVEPLRSALCRRGLDVGVRDMEDIYFHVELAPDVAGALVEVWSGAPDRAA